MDSWKKNEESGRRRYAGGDYAFVVGTNRDEIYNEHRDTYSSIQS